MTHRPLVRRLAVALAAVQIVVYAAAPSLEARSQHGPGPLAFERAHTHACVVLHTPDSCLVCQLLAAVGQPAGIDRFVVATREAVAPASGALASAAPRAPPAPVQSRAPPLHLA